MKTPTQENFYMPAEWYQHECCWMQWPTEFFPINATSSWSHFDLDKGRLAWANVANAISRFEKLKMIVHPSDSKSALNLLDKNVEILQTPIDDAWCRDTGAIFLLNEKNQLGGVDSDFNCWGYKENFEQDDKVAKFMINEANAKYFKNDMVLEGGSIHVNGQGTLITTEQCLLHENRNPHLSKDDIENNLKKFFGVTKIIWLKHGTDEGTNGHIDNVACFSDTGTILAMTCSDKEDTYYDLLSENLEILRTSVDQDNNPLKIVELEMSKKRLIPDDDEPSSYINFYIANDAVIFPIFGDDVADQNALKIVKSQFPNRQIVCLDGHDILMGGGNIHCITQQQPKALL
ncbi:agmatine deiminase family protein [Pelagibacteraceae bacterium]|nr:agmatine deiminase family protein [Pelagibacteraceae bacterium]